MLPAEGRRLFLHAGHIVVAREPTEITTILGSCVAMCLWDPVAGVGGMNHYMLPHDVGANYATPRHAKYATHSLIVQLVQAGAAPHRLRAKVYGGACILTSGFESKNDLGAANVRVARELLAAERIPIEHEETGGMHGRKLFYQSATGVTTVAKVSRVIP